MDDVVKGKEKKLGLISKTWERCKSFRVVRAKTPHGIKQSVAKRSVSWPRVDATKEKTLNNIAPKGCFSVYVGPERQRFVIKAEHANHPLFKALLVEAECEYGYRVEGPLELPCEVRDFITIMLEIDDCYKIISHQECNLLGSTED